MEKEKIHYKNPFNLIWAIPVFFLSIILYVIVWVIYTSWYIPFKFIQASLVSNSEGYERVAKEFNKEIVKTYGFSTRMIAVGKRIRSSCKS